MSPPKLNAETLSDEALACWQIGCASSRTAPTSPPRTLPNCRACPRPRRAHTHAHTRTHARAHGRERGKGERQGAQAQRPREQAPPVTPKEPTPTSHVKSLALASSASHWPFHVLLPFLFLILLCCFFLLSSCFFCVASFFSLRSSSFFLLCLLSLLFLLSSQSGSQR